MYDAVEDPYTHKNSTVLKNKLDLRNQAELDAFEAEISTARAEERCRKERWISTITAPSTVTSFRTCTIGRDSLGPYG